MQNTITITIQEAVQNEKQISLPAFIKKDGIYSAIYSKERLIQVCIFGSINIYSIQSDKVDRYTFNNVEFISEAEFMQAFKIAEKKITDSLSVLNMAISYANKTEDQEKQELRLEAQIGDAIESLEIEEVSND